ncbi:MAG: DUF167 domain-containing protein [Patescibacteria group bacterium]
MSHFVVRVIPNAKISEVAGFRDGAWAIRLAAPAVEGKANKELISLLADTLDLAPSTVDIVKGFGSRIKTVEVPLPAIRIEESFQNKTPSA